MIFYLSRFGDDFLAGLIGLGAIATALLIGISFHEFSHAFVADRLGDRLPRRMGRVTLNPLAHLDPLGTVLMLLIGFGWGKPVPINPNNTANPRAALWMTALAGPGSNFLVAAVAGLTIRLGVVPWVSPFNRPQFQVLSDVGWAGEDYVGLYLSAVTVFSVVLGVFNLFPIAPLDGFKVALGLLPPEAARSFAKLERWGALILLSSLFLLPFATGGQYGIFSIMQPVIQSLVDIFTGSSQDIWVA